ncbi:coiled-coil domain-containing protein 148 [Biomphalaria pfeifferi]|uniref:Coiled-coil domain-containing protein 148 n=1 Tax=Biomphalaria pfeifferi TaxID=112525 RepID=A0AAD8B7W5_BIOPF|nr:coiled-coil domain-containing protein 148 [Biomphalaria pfeifferi]
MEKSQWQSSTSLKYVASDGLVHRMLDGLGSNKYHAVDYNSMRAAISQKRFASIKASMKLNEIEKSSQQHKENSILKQHQLVWQKEFIRLQHLRKKAEMTVESHMRTNFSSDMCGPLYKEIDYFDGSLEADFEGFKKNTVEPVWMMRDDLKYWLSEHREELKYGNPDIIEKHREITKTIDSVKGQQQIIQEKLQYEEECLEAELQSDVLLELCPSALQKHVAVHPGIPQEAMELECLDPNLKSDVLQEFLIIDERYQTMIEELKRKHSFAMSSDDGWEEDEHFKFVAVMDQYPREMMNRRKLLLDRLKKHLPTKSFAELSRHEDWWTDCKYFHERLKVAYFEWARDRRELLHKAQMTFAEVAVAQELEEVRNEYHHRQKQFCQILYEKVKEWRERKMEMMHLEAQLNEERQRQALEQRLQEEESEKRRRNKEKENIQRYHFEQEKQRRETEATAEKRLQELKELMEKQAVYDRERIKYREEQISQKLEERKQKEIEKVKEEEEMQARLEALRSKVRVIAESDPLRALQGTKAWEAHLKQEEFHESAMLEPLFKVNSYTAKQITSDHRIRLEQKLREAGLHNTEYARTMIRKATPPLKPRKDLFHTFKFQDDS